LLSKQFEKEKKKDFYGIAWQNGTLGKGGLKGAKEKAHFFVKAFSILLGLQPCSA
jgi:hypothetical protein